MACRMVRRENAGPVGTVSGKLQTWWAGVHAIPLREAPCPVCPAPPFPHTLSSRTCHVWPSGSDVLGHASTRESGTGLTHGLGSILLLRTVGPGAVTALWDTDTRGTFASGAGR